MVTQGFGREQPAGAQVCVLPEGFSKFCCVYFFQMMTMSSLEGMLTVGIIKLKDISSPIVKTNSYYHSTTGPRNSMAMASPFQIQSEMIYCAGK